MATRDIPGLPPMPWAVAPDDPADTVVILEYPGEFEPRRKCVFYGGSTVAGAFGPRPPRPATLRLRQFNDVLVTPHHVLLSYRDARILPTSFALGHFLSCLDPGIADKRAPQFYNTWHCTGDATRVDEPVFLAEPGWDPYGHVLLEAVPKLMMLADLPQQTAVISSGMFFAPLFEAFGVGRERLATFTGPVYCRTLYVPDSPVDLSGNLHSLARTAYERIASFVGTVRGEQRLYWSRSKIGARPLRNEADVETLFARYGFTIVHPETLPVEDQIRLVASAGMIAGPGGSAMHSLVFAHKDARALILTSDSWFAEIDQYIARRDGQLGYVLGRAHRQEGIYEREWPWTVELDLVEHAIRAHFGL